MFWLSHRNFLIVDRVLKGFEDIHDDTMLYCVHDINDCTHENSVSVLPHLNAVERIIHPIN